MKSKSLAIPIRCVDFSNSSQVVSFFTRERGLLEGLAKGAHRGKNPFQGPFDLAVLYEVVSLERPSAGLALLTEASVLDGFSGIRRGWERHVAASHLIEFLRTVAVPGDPCPGLFDLAVTTFRDLARADAGATGPVLTRFDLRALHALGLFAPLLECLHCGRRWSGDNRSVYFSVAERGLLCTGCRARTRQGAGQSLPGAVVRAFNRVVEDEKADARRGENLDILANVAARDVVTRLRTNLLERELVLLKSTARWV